MTNAQYAAFIATANRINEICDEKGIPCHAAVCSIYLDFGAGWMDYSIVIRDLTRPAHSVTASFQINFSERNLILAGNIDAAVEAIMQYNSLAK